MIVYKTKKKVENKEYIGIRYTKVHTIELYIAWNDLDIGKKE